MGSSLAFRSETFDKIQDHSLFFGGQPSEFADDRFSTLSRRLPHLDPSSHSIDRLRALYPCSHTDTSVIIRYDQPMELCPAECAFVLFLKTSVVYTSPTSEEMNVGKTGFVQNTNRH